MERIDCEKCYQALEEVQAYRAIGLTLEVVQELKRMDMEQGGEILGVIKSFKELGQYRAIGTVEEFKALKEKNNAVSREIRHGDYFCPKCGSLVEYQGYCHACGQKVH